MLSETLIINCRIAPSYPRSRQHLVRSRTIPTRARQQGITLLISLIVLVIMTLAGIQLMRSVDTTNIIAGNLAFQQAATHSGDGGIEAAIQWLETQNNTGSANLYNDQNTALNCNGYSSNYTPATEPPLAGATWDTWWNALSTCKIVTLAADSAGNVASYTIQRMCSQANSPNTTSTTQFCSSSPILILASDNSSQTAGAQHLIHNGQIYYRVTSRINGPRGTKSYVQAMVAM